MSILQKVLNFVLLSGMILCLQDSAIGHPGGHYKKGDHFNTWEMANGRTVQGNFSTSIGTLLILEQAGGRMVAVPMDQLNSRYRKMAQMKIARIARLNAQFLQDEERSVINRPNPYTYIIFTVFLLGIILYVTLYLHAPRDKKMAFGLGLYGLFVLSTLYAFAPFLKFHFIKKTDPGYIDSAFTVYKPQVSTRWDANNFYVSSNGLPDHSMMVGITNWQQQVPLPQDYTGTNSWTIPLQPVLSERPLSTKHNFMRGAVAIAVNGIPIFNALNNRGEDSFSIGELDKWGGHCGKGDDYHYHAAPLSLQNRSGLQPIAFCLDGFAVYGDKEPDGSAMQPLDSCHGHNYKNGVYHYHGTKTYPYVIGALRGEVKMDDATLAPENQIMPQAFTMPLRPPTRPLRGAVITDLKKLNADSFLLTYQVSGRQAYIQYNWDNLNNYLFEFTDPQGVKTTETYTRPSHQPRK